MQILGNVLLVGLGLFIALVIGMNIFVRRAARALAGQPLPELPGQLGKSISGAKQGLVYFFSPGCAACRPITPKIKALSSKNKNVFAVDVTENLDLARALRVMATPSILEIGEGRVVDVHVGGLPPALLQKFS
jgi:thiol-disulfide isomerase/thioredoxin